MTGAESALMWRLARGRRLDCRRPVVMAILNLTPDSFSDGGAYPAVDDAVRAASRAVEDGAAILDVGGESTRPGAAPVDEAEQVARVLPVVRAIRGAGGLLGEIPISVDTTRSGVARAALEAGADAINDTSAGTDDHDMFALAASSGAGLVLMHRPRPPAEDSYSDQYAAPPDYPDVAATVRAFLAVQMAGATRAGVSPDAIALDPGLGFGKTVEQNFALIARTDALLSLGRPVVSGASRKSFVGRVSIGAQSEPRLRVAGSVAASIAHFLAGASIFRVHDVAEQLSGLRVAEAVRRGREPRSAGPAKT